MPEKVSWTLVCYPGSKKRYQLVPIPPFCMGQMPFLVVDFNFDSAVEGTAFGGAIAIDWL